MDKFSKDIENVVKAMEKLGYSVRPESAIDTQNKYFLNKSDLFFDPPKKLKVGKYGQVTLVVEVSNKGFYPLNIFPALQIQVDGLAIFIPGMYIEGFYVHLRKFHKAGEKTNSIESSIDKINWIMSDFQDKANKLAALEIGQDDKIDNTLQDVLKEVVKTRFSIIFNHTMKDIGSINFMKTKVWDIVKMPVELKGIVKSSEPENALEAMIATQFNFCFSEKFVFPAYVKNKNGELATLKAKSIKQNYRNTIFKRLIANIYFQNFFDKITDVKLFNMKNYFN